MKKSRITTALFSLATVVFFLIWADVSGVSSTAFSQIGLEPVDPVDNSPYYCGTDRPACPECDVCGSCDLIDPTIGQKYCDCVNGTDGCSTGGVAGAVRGFCYWWPGSTCPFDKDVCGTAVVPTCNGTMVNGTVVSCSVGTCKDKWFDLFGSAGDIYAGCGGCL